MDYQYYKFEGDSYRLKRQGFSVLYIVVAICIVAMFVMSLSIGGGRGATSLYFPCTFLLLLIIIYLLSSVIKTKVVINPNTKIVTIKPAIGKEKQYPFSEFLNFQKTKTRVRSGLIPLFNTYRISMFFNDNGKNRVAFLNQTSSQKKADVLIAETADLLGKSTDSDGLVITTRQNRWY